MLESGLDLLLVCSLVSWRWWCSLQASPPNQSGLSQKMGAPALYTGTLIQGLISELPPWQLGDWQQQEADSALSLEQREKRWYRAQDPHCWRKLESQERYLAEARA